MTICDYYKVQSYGRRDSTIQDAAPSGLTLRSFGQVRRTLPFRGQLTSLEI